VRQVTEGSIDGAYGSGRVSSQRAAIASAVLRLGAAFTVDELSEALAADSLPTASATVYRAVAAMESCGWLERVGERGGSALFARCSAGGHHHHLVCERCGRVASAGCPVGRDLQSAAQEAGFTLTRHEVTLYGLCAECSAATPNGA
jgi:Fur family ferric uptake transcriptional regulator